MARPRRSCTKRKESLLNASSPKRRSVEPCDGEGNSDFENRVVAESMDNDVFVISDATGSSSTEEDEDGNGYWKVLAASIKAKGKIGKGRGKRKKSSRRDTPWKCLGIHLSPSLNPDTPESGPPKRRRSATLVDVTQARASVEHELSESSDSEFVVDSEETSSDDALSDDSYIGGTAKKNSRARNGRVAARPVHVDEVDTELRLVVDNRRGGNVRGRRKGNQAAPKIKSRAKGKPQPEPENKLGWEISDDEWTAEWGKATDADFDAIKSAKFPVEQREPPKELLMPLLPFQKEWLAWSMKQEAGPVKGGILADEMGMGKTIQAISLVVAGRALTKSQPEIDMNSMASSSNAAKTSSSETKSLPKVKATLVVCPVVAVIQWRNEISRFTLNGSVKVLIYHGPRRNISVAEIAEYDFILTTYSIVELEHRKYVMPPKDACKWCRQLFYPERMVIHQRYYCGPNAQRTAKQAKQQKRKNRSEPFGSGFSDHSDSEYDPEDMEKGKSIASLLSNRLSSDDDLEEDLKGKKRGKSAAKGKNSKKGKAQKPANEPSGQGKRGRRKKIKVDELQNALAEALESAEVIGKVGQASTSNASKGNSVLHSVRWGRIILDEAHSIKDRRCSTAKAVFALQSEYKWALSGTPLQNRVGELYSLVRFLGIHPFSYYFCRKCECKSLEYQFAAPGEKCKCGHSPLHHFCWWNKFVANPIKRWGYVNDGRKAMMLLKHKVLSNVLLRRTKLERAADLALPQRTAFLRRDAFDLREKDFYQALYTQSQSQFNTYVTAGTLVNNYAHIFDLLTRLRQAVDHPYLVVYSATARKDAPSFESTAGDELCGLCHEAPEDSVTTGCNHNFCRSCIQGFIDAAQGLNSKCPDCAKPLTVDFTGKSTNDGKEASLVKTYKRSSILNRIDLQQFQSSTKIEAVRTEAFQMLREDPSAKAIIFSQFTSMLDLIGYALGKSGIKFVKLDGSMSMAARDQMIDKFTNDAETKIFLMSLKAGGVALNLTVASRVFLMDPWWNPAVEQQAQDRIHRLGQYRPIRVIRFVIENTIEERILKLQEKKQLVFEGTVGGSTEALGRLTEEDLRFLFTS